MNEAEMKQYLTDLAREAFPDSITPWPAIQGRLQISDRGVHPRGFTMKTQNPTTTTFYPAARFAAIVSLAVLLAGVVFLITPQGRAWAQEILHFFNRSESNIMPGITVTPMKWVEQTPGVAAATITPQPTQNTPPGPAFEATCGSYQAAHCSIEDIRSIASFPVFALPKLPEGMHFTGATGGPEQVHLFYDTSNQTGFIIIQEKPFTGTESQLSMEVGADADIQPVQVGSVPGEYVKGSYDGSGNPPVWNSNLDLQQMRWVNKGVLFTLYHQGTQPRLSRDELVALAATLTHGPVGDTGQPVIVANDTLTPEPTFDPRTLYPLTLAQAEEQAGFTPLSPLQLPEIWTFLGASYDEETKIVTIGYNYTDPNFPGAANALIIREQLAAEGVDCDLCGFSHRDERRALLETPALLSEKMLPPDATIETVQIGDWIGQFVQGVEYNGGQWDPIPYRKRLRFQMNGVAIEVWSDNNEMAKADLIAIAESLTESAKGAQSEGTANRSTPYPLTFQEAEEQIGWDLVAPARLPEMLIFNGASVETLSAHPPIITLSYRLSPKWGQPDGNGMLIREQIISTSDPCRLCEFVIGQYTGTETARSGRTVDANATIETVKVGNADGQYVEGGWKGTDQGWVYDPDPYIKTLRWQADGKAFEITYFGKEFTQENMIAIAESMK